MTTAQTGTTADQSPARRTDAEIRARYLHYDAYAAYRAGFSEDETAAEEKTLAGIFARAGKSDTFARALGWAARHGIRFTVDNGCAIGGYYTTGTGVVAISGNLPEERLAPVMTHEIRHAWHDWHAMVPSDIKNVSVYFRQIALIEADAMAFEWQAQNEEQFGLRRDEMDLRDSFFADWYKTRAAWYGDRVANGIGAQIGLDAAVPARENLRFTPYADHSRATPYVSGINIRHKGVLARLTRGFDGEDSYLPAAVQNRLVGSDGILRHANALRIFNKRAKPDALMASAHRLVNAMGGLPQTRVAPERKRHGA